jgi:lysophospholipase L1-like esterase
MFAADGAFATALETWRFAKHRHQPTSSDERHGQSRIDTGSNPADHRASCAEGVKAMKKWRGRLLVLVVAVLLPACVNHSVREDRVHLILAGDSTVARITGYGDALCARFDALTKCENLARNGRSSKSYRAEGLWDEVLAHAREPGYHHTFVLVQFGHNDQPGKPERSTTLSEFRANMRRYTDEVRGAGAAPILVTPLTRRTFKDGKLADGLGPWAEATAAVASESGTVLLDLHRDSMAAVAALGPVEALSLAELPPPEAALAAAATGTTIEVEKPAASMPGAHVAMFDYTHLGPKGAELFSGIVAAEIARSVPELAYHLRNNPALGEKGTAGVK